MRGSADPSDAASLLTAATLGLFVMLRAKAPRKVVKSAARVAIEYLEALT